MEILVSEKIVHVKKAARVSPSDREFVRSELDWLAKWVRKSYPDMNYCDLRKFISEMVTVSV
jgi:hypothetical protein